MPAGIGYADIAFLPITFGKPAMIIELKYDRSADSAIQQIKDKHYYEVLGDYSGEVVLVGINYDRSSKTHECVIERINL